MCQMGTLLKWNQVELKPYQVELKPYQVELKPYQIATLLSWNHTKWHPNNLGLCWIETIPDRNPTGPKPYRFETLSSRNPIESEPY